MAEPSKSLQASLGWSRKEVKQLIASLDLLCPEGQLVCTFTVDLHKRELTIEGEVYKFSWGKKPNAPR